MTFLNEALLLGLAAAVIPLAIHLLHRSRHRVVRWGAMHLLRESVARRSRRFRLEQLLLLLVRMAAVACLALLLARPVLTEFAGIPGLSGGPVARVLVIDVSYSMGRGDVWQRALDTSREVVRQMQGGDSLHVLLATSRPESLGSKGFGVSDSHELLDLLENVRPIHAPSDLFAAIRYAEETLESVVVDRRELIVVSDFQSLVWGEDTRAALVPDPEASENLSVILVPLRGSMEDARANVAVDDIGLNSDIAIVGEELELRVSLSGELVEEDRDVRVVLTIDGKESLERTVRLSAEEFEVRFRRSFEEPGEYRLEASVGSDVLDGDNRFYRLVSVRESVPVLVVDGGPPGSGTLESSGFLQIALAPFRGDGGLRRNIFEPEVVSADQLSADTLSRFAIVYLVNVSSFERDVTRALERFVREGGGLVIFGGNALRQSYYNLQLYRSGEGIFPGKIVSGAELTSEGDLTRGIVVEATDHLAMRSLVEAREDMSRVEVDRFHRLRLDAALSPDRRSRVLASLPSGDPFLVEKKVGDGKVVFCTTAADAAPDDRWSNFPIQTVFLPFVHDLTLSLLPESDAPKNIHCGEALQLWLPERGAGEKVVLRSTSGLQDEVELLARDGKTLLDYKRTSSPGFFFVFSAGERVATVAANVVREESSGALVETAELVAPGSQDNVKVYEGEGDWQSIFRDRQYGTEIWKPLLAVLLILLFFEMALQQRFGGVRR